MNYASYYAEFTYLSYTYLSVCFASGLKRQEILQNIKKSVWDKHESPRGCICRSLTFSETLDSRPCLRVAQPPTLHFIEARWAWHRNPSCLQCQRPIKDSMLCRVPQMSLSAAVSAHHTPPLKFEVRSHTQPTLCCGNTFAHLGDTATSVHSGL